MNKETPPPVWHSLDRAAVLTALTSNERDGLSAHEAQQRLEQFGPNALEQGKRRSWLSVFMGQFASPLIYLLFGVAAVAFALGHTNDGIVIFVVVTVNSLIGALQEGRAEKSLDALRQLATQSARVVRNGQESLVEANDLVPGDVVLMEAGDAVVADGYVLSAHTLQVAEAALTGESVPVHKTSGVMAADASLADRTNMVFAGTNVVAGRARTIVVATGATREIGHIAQLAQKAKVAPTPLEARVAQFGRYIIWAAGVMFALVLGIGLLRGIPLGELVMVGISQVVGMVPEGLPVAMTIALAVGVQRMANRKAVVRRLAAVETLGATTVICTDKTGTLTKNEMTVTEVVLADGRTLQVSGNGYEPVGTFKHDEQDVVATADDQLTELLHACVLCNDAQLVPPEAGTNVWKPMGDPTEVALIAFAMKGEVAPEKLRAQKPREGELPFDAATRMMATQHKSDQGAHVYIKGAPEAVLELCSSADQSAMKQAADRMAAAALRVLAVAKVKDAAIDPSAGFAAFGAKATLLGLVGQMDPPRAEVKDAVEKCRAAGIRPVMVTGDHKATGLAIATTLGIAVAGDEAVDGRELARLSETELANRIDTISVFARVDPAQKLRIVDAYQKRGHIVAMTGDGVNDAPALVKANVGVAMGITGTAVAKEAAKIVILDDNFATIVAAVEEGRVVYRNIKKTVLHLLSTSAAEVLVLMLALMLGYPPPFLAVQILWNNLVTEGVLTVNLVMDPPEGNEMSQPPIDANEPLLSKLLRTRMFFMVPAMVVSAAGWWIWRAGHGVALEVVRTETFTLLAVCEWFNVLNCRSETKTAFTLSVLRNHWLIGGLLLGNALQALVVYWPPLSGIFHTVPLDLKQVVLIGVVGSSVLWVEEIRKFFARRQLRAVHA